MPSVSKARRVSEAKNKAKRRRPRLTAPLPDAPILAPLTSASPDPDATLDAIESVLSLELDPDPIAEFTVSEYLAQSWHAHGCYRQAIGKDRHTLKQALARAYQARCAAHAIDPRHDDPAWAEEQVKTAPNQDTHTMLMAFYQKALSR